ncbi:MAG: hypothetical protein ABIL01_11565, partial [Pseudomonadota bacterium]
MICVEHLVDHARQRDFLARVGHPPELVHQQPAERLKLLVRQRKTGFSVEIVQRDLAADRDGPVAARREEHDVAVLVDDLPF